MKPEISILVSTFNRKELVKNSLDSILMQTFTDYELLIIDDQSTDETQEEILQCYPDTRIKYFYNEVNQAAEHGDKIHIRRFVHEMAKGKYWVYLDSDDRWLSPTLLARQIALFEAYPEASMITGGQESHFILDNKKVFTADIFPHVMTSSEFLEHFANHPIASNIIGGARLYNREMFIKSGALQSNDGRWEAGFELSISPACYGSHIYIDEPCIQTDVRPENASFNQTQRIHFTDSVAGVKAGFKKALIDFPNRGLAELQRRTIENIGKTYLGNSQHINQGGTLGYCSTHNTSELVRQGDVDEALASL